MPSLTFSPELKNQRILIIDDNTSIHEDVRKILGVASSEDESLDSEAAELFGTAPAAGPRIEFQIDSAFQGEEGLALVEKAREEGRPYAVAFVDVRMPPGWDGITTIGHLWRACPELQVVICTAYSDYSWEEMIRALGKTESLVILKKPFDNIEVLQLAHTLTEKWSLNHRLKEHVGTLDRAVAHRTAELQAANGRLQQEIIEREEAQRQLVSSEERFSKSFRASPIPMAIQSLSTERYLEVNDAFTAVTGYSREEITGRTPVEIGLMPDGETEAPLLAQLRQEHSVRDFACELRCHDGKLRDCCMSAEVIELGSDHVALVAALDVSEQRRLEKQLRQSQKLEAVGQLAAGVAHDFNNILTIIQGHATMQLAGADLEEDVANSFDQVSMAAERAAGLTRQLLAFSRKQIVLPRALSVNAVIRNLHDMLRRLIGEHIRLSCEFAEELPDVYADESNVEQIVMNLVVNARDAMEYGGELIIRTELIDLLEASPAAHPEVRPGRFIRLSVSDTGCGMSSETLGHVFEPFFTTKEVGQGTGLGLATVYGIVAQHEGWITVESEVNRGTTFSVHLPVATASAIKPESALAPPLPKLRGGHETILLVEDEAEVREIVSGILESHGYNVLGAADGLEAIEIWAQRAGSVDLLVTDIVMPNGLKGNALAARLRHEKPELRVIYSSGYSQDVTESPDFGDQCIFLQKPYKLDGLIRAVRNCLDATLCVA